MSVKSQCSRGDLATYVAPAEVVGGVADDDRRTIYDLLDNDLFPTAGHVNAIICKGGPGTRVLGNHYHEDWECFRVVAGILPLAIMEDVDSGERRVWRDLPAGTHITIPPRTAHAFLRADGCILMGALRENFNPSDMHKFDLMTPEGEEIPK